MQLEHGRDRLPAELYAPAQRLLSQRETLRRALADAADAVVDVLRIRVHGDPALTRVLVAENDVIFIDFGGDWRAVSEERRDEQCHDKHCPLTDVARVVRAFHEVADDAVQANSSERAGALQPEPLLAAIGDWRARSCRRFVDAYRESLGPRARAANGELPPQPEAALIRLWAVHGAAARLRETLASARRSRVPDQAAIRALGRAMRVLSSITAERSW
jgi:maltose alpha-D-glucosyltransferase/alpha-amylase